MLLSLLAAVVRAEDQHVQYDLSFDGQKVGTRELTVRYLPRPDGERRVLTVTTVLRGGPKPLEARSSGSSSPRGANFTTSVESGGAVSQVQAIELPGGGFRVTRADRSGVYESTLKAYEARLSTLDLLDPGRTGLLANPGPVGILVAETGDILSGTLGEPSAAVDRIAGRDVPVTRYTLSSDGVVARFDVDAEGLLMRSEMRWLGATLVAQAHGVPAPRDWVGMEGEDNSTGPAVTEDAL